jgi:hypothetical protein
MIKLKEGQKVTDVKGNTYLVEKGDLIESKHLKEQKNITIHVVYVSGMSNSIQKTYDIKNYKNASKIEASLESEFNSDDYGIDEIWVEGLDNLDLNWTRLLESKGRLNIKMVETLFSSDATTVFAKLSFCEEMGYDPDTVFDDLIVLEYRNKMYSVNDTKTWYPEEFVYELQENNFSDIEKLLSKHYASELFDWVEFLNVQEINGVFTSLVVTNNLFVYFYGS